jgi:hypothetical protein
MVKSRIIDTEGMEKEKRKKKKRVVFLSGVIQQSAFKINGTPQSKSKLPLSSTSLTPYRFVHLCSFVPFLLLT